jgi:hypothetical protein
MDYLQKPVNLVINQDWNEILTKYDTIHSMMLAGKFDKDSKWVPEWVAMQYNFSSMGAIVLDKVLSKDWGTWTGPLLYSHLKWMQHAEKFFADLNFQGVGLSVTYEDIAIHTDGKLDEERLLPQCKLLYVVRSDDKDAVTISHDKDNLSLIQSMVSVPGTSFLLNTNAPHEVKSKGYRAVLQFKFLEDFKTVSKFVDNCGPISFG